MAVNQEVQKKVQAEIDLAFAETKGEITDEFLQKLEFLDRCIQETARMHSPGNFFPEPSFEKPRVYNLKFSHHLIVFTLMKICISEYEFPGQYEESTDRLMIEPGIVCIIPTRAIHL